MNSLVSPRSRIRGTKRKHQQVHQTKADARVAAFHLRGLIEAKWFDRLLFQVLKDVTMEEINATVNRTVATFMAA